MSVSYQTPDPTTSGKPGSGRTGAAGDAHSMLLGNSPGASVPDETAPAGLQLFAPRVKRIEIADVTSQLGLMVETGINLSIGLQGIAEQTKNPTLRKTLFSLKASVDSGEDFSAALARYPRLFDETYVSLVRASEATGSLGEMLDRIADYMRKEAETWSKVRSALAYPSIMLVMAIGVTIFLIAFIFPKFAPLFARKGVKLPKPTLVLMTVSEGFTEYWYLWVIALGLMIGALVASRTTESGRRIWDWLKIHVPVLGTVTRKVIVSRSLRTLGTMLAGGVPLLDALQLCSRVAANIYYQELWAEVSQSVTEGRRITDALLDTPLIPTTIVQMIASGEEAGKLDRVLERISIFYDREVENALKTATSIIEPVMIAVMGVVVGSIAMALLLPIFTLSQNHG